MSDRWWRPLDEGVDALASAITDAAWSPDGALLAAHGARRDASDLVARERVWCVDDRSGEVVGALDGPRTLRAFAWIDGERLAVLRDAPGGMSLSLHAMPDGGAVAERFLPGASEWRATIRTTPDARTLLVAPRWTGYERPAPPALVLAVDDLAVRAVIAPSSRPAVDDVTVDDDGDRWALLEPNATTAGPTRLRLGRCGEGGAQERVVDLGDDVLAKSVRWVDRGALMILATSYGRGARIAVTDDGGTTLRAVFAYMRPSEPDDWEADGPDDFFDVPLTHAPGLGPAAAFIRVLREEGPRAELLLVDPRDGAVRAHPLPATTSGYGLAGVHDRGDDALVLLHLQGDDSPAPDGLYRTAPGGLVRLHAPVDLGESPRLMPIDSARAAVLLDRRDAFELRRVRIR